MRRRSEWMVVTGLAIGALGTIATYIAHSNDEFDILDNQGTRFDAGAIQERLLPPHMPASQRAELYRINDQMREPIREEERRRGIERYSIRIGGPESRAREAIDRILLRRFGWKRAGTATGGAVYGDGSTTISHYDEFSNPETGDRIELAKETPPKQGGTLIVNVTRTLHPLRPWSRLARWIQRISVGQPALVATP